MPVPEPRPGFVERALRNATRRDASVSGRLRAAMRRPTTWWAAGAGRIARRRYANASSPTTGLIAASGAGHVPGE